MVATAVIANPTRVRKGVELKLNAFWTLSSWLAIHPVVSLIEEDLFECHKYLSYLDLEHYVLHLLQGAGLLVVPLLLHLANNLHHLRSLTSSSFSAESVNHHVPEEGHVDIMS